MSFKDIYNNVNKQAAAMLTPQAMQAAVQPPAPPQGAPMDPAMSGGMPPQGAPMDPAMMGGDPTAMGAVPQGAPMDPAMAGGMPPQGAPAGGGAWLQDPMFLEFLASMGVQVGPDGMAIDPQGNPVDPALMDQLYTQFQAQMSGQGAPMDPAMAGGMPPQEAPMDPAMGQMPPAQLPPEILDQFAGVIQQVIDSSLDAKLAALQKKIVAYSQKLDTIKSLLDDVALGVTDEDAKRRAQDRSMDDELEQQLKRQQQPVQVVQPVPTQVPVPAAPSNQDMLSLMRG